MPRRRGRWWKWLAGASGGPLLLFGLSNLWLATPPGRGWIAARFSRLTGLEARVGPASWTPWGGVSLRRIELLAPEPLRASLGRPMLEVDRITVRPHWRPLLKGLLVLRTVEVEQPRLRLPVELLSFLAAQRPAVVV